MSFSFPTRSRLGTHGVEAVLKSGIRLRGKVGSPWLLRLLPSTEGSARLAITVPKRWVKSSVMRNLLKRQVREAFRVHRLRAAPIDLLVSVVATCAPADAATRLASRTALTQLLDQAAVRLPTAERA